MNKICVNKKRQRQNKNKKIDRKKKIIKIKK